MCGWIMRGIRMGIHFQPRNRPEYLIGSMSITLLDAHAWILPAL